MNTPERLLDHLTSRLNPPVITMRGESGVDALMAHIRGLKFLPNQLIADAEAKRLTPYFGAMEGRMSPGKTNRDEGVARAVQGLGSKRLNLVTYRQIPQGGADNVEWVPGYRIAQMFRRVASDTGCVILSDVAVAPCSVYTDLKDNRDKSISMLSKETTLSRYASYFMGFIKTIRENDKTSVAFPVMALADHVLAEVEGSAVAVDLLGSLQKIASHGSHDMMHHLTSPVINENVSSANKTGMIAAYKMKLDDVIDYYTPRGVSDEHVMSYESWALSSHAKTWREETRLGQDRGIINHAETFANALITLSAELQASGKPKSYCTQVVEYLSNVGGFNLMRSVPLTHPAMAVMLRGAEDACPDKRMAEEDIMSRSDFLRRFVSESNADDSAFMRLRRLYSAMLERPGFVHLASYSGWTDIAVRRFNKYIDVLAVRDFVTGCPQVDVGGTQNLITLLGSADLSEEGIKTWMRVNRMASSAIEKISDIFTLGARHVFLDDSGDVEDARENMIEAVVTMMYKSIESYADGYQNLPDYDAIKAELKGMTMACLEENAAINNSRSACAATLRNYAVDGTPMVTNYTANADYRTMKIFDWLTLSPEIPYLLSPDTDDALLKQVRQNSDFIDRGVIRVLSRFSSLPGGPK